MPGRSWRDLQPNPATHASPADTPGGRQETAPVAQQSLRLASLLKQREALESRMQALTSGNAEPLDPRDAARFQITSFAERRAQQRAWEQKRDSLQQGAAKLRRAPPNPNSGRATPTTSPTSRRTTRENPVSQWLARRDQQRQQLHTAARDRLSPLNSLSQVGRRLQAPLASTTEKLRGLDRQLAKHGLDQERDELRHLGSGKITKASAKIGKYTRMAEAPKRAVEKIDRFWQKRQQQISGPMDRVGPYVERSQRRLSVDRGGSGDLFERMQRNRMRALQRRQQQRREEERDQARRDRALRNRRQRKEK